MSKGFQDVSGEYPRRQTKGQSGVNPAARGIKSDEQRTTGKRGPRVSSLISQVAAKAVSEPGLTRAPQYPYNHVQQTSSGHTIELDDTPGGERVSIRHRTGAKIEMRPDGSVTVRSSNNLYEIVAGDKDAIVRGSVNIVVESNADIRVNGDVNMQVDGDSNTLVQGNYNLEVQGSYNVRIHGDEIVRTTGGELHETRGNAIRRNLSNYTERTVGDYRSEVGGSWFNTVEGDIHEMSYGELQASYHGGLWTINGVDADGAEGAGTVVSSNIYNENFYGKVMVNEGTLDITGDVVFDGNLDVTGEIKSDGTIHTPLLEGTAKRAQWSTTAGSAPTGPSTPVTASPSSAGSVEAREDDPDSEESVVDVSETSEPFILALDRQPVTGFNTRLLNTYEVVARCRNRALRTNSDWLQDQLDNGSILESISNTRPPAIIREGQASTFTSGVRSVGQASAGAQSVPLYEGNRLPVPAIPENALLTENIGRGSQLSPNFNVSHMLAGDSLSANLISQAGLSITQIAQNMQLVSYNVLEELRDKYSDTWTIAEGLYNLLPNEQVDSSSVTVDMVRGRGVGVQFVTQPNSFYFEAAQWIRNNMVFDQLILSYIDYDPAGINEPTLIITVKPGENRRLVSTEFNHVKVADNILELDVG